MLIRACRVSVALAAMLSVASLCFAADSGHVPGKAGIGGLIGGSTFKGDRILGSEWFGDYSAGARPRFAFYAQFRYVATPRLRFQLSPGFTWAGYDGALAAPFQDPRFPQDPDKREYLSLLAPVSLQAQLLLQRGNWVYHAGAGPGVYRVWVENNREVLKDAYTLALHRGFYAGASGQLGVEYFLKQLPNTSVEFAIGGDLAFARRDEQFVSGLNSSVMAVGARIGGNFYFDPTRGLTKEKARVPKP